MASAGAYPAASGFEGESGKHFKVHERAKRFDPEHKWGCLQGRTATARGELHRHDEVYEMEVERPETDQGVALSAVDMNSFGRPELLTSTPVKEGLAQELMEELEKLCASSAIHRHPENRDFAVRVFELPILGFRKGGGVVQADQLVQLCSPPARQDPDTVPQTFATLALAPPEEVLEQSLMRRARLSWKGCADLPTKRSGRSAGVRPAKAALRYPTQQQLTYADTHLDCWVQDAPESYLEVDLGANCSVTYVSTAGRFPRTERYPSHQLSQRWSKEGREPLTSARHYWDVVKPGSDGWEQWVTRYELHARLDAGRAWETIATLKGNTDMTTEVAHDMRELCANPEGLKCRYLRFIPQGFHGKAAMRIGVYGIGIQHEAAVQKKPEEERIRYIIPVPLTNRNRRRCGRDFVNRRARSPEFIGKYGADFEISTRRKQRARETLQEGREAVGRDREAPLQRQDSALYDSDGGAGGEEQEADGQGAADAPAEVQAAQPSLQRALSRRAEEAVAERAQLQRTRTDEERGYCSEPEDLLADWTVL